MIKIGFSFTTIDYLAELLDYFHHPAFAITIIVRAIVVIIAAMAKIFSSITNSQSKLQTLINLY